jgi:hypothetical protein
MTDKTGLEQFVEWFESWSKEIDWWTRSPLIMDKARQLLAESRSKAPSVVDTLNALLPWIDEQTGPLDKAVLRDKLICVLAGSDKGVEGKERGLVKALKEFGNSELVIYTALYEAHKNDIRRDVYGNVLSVVQSIIRGMDDVISRHEGGTK